MEKVKASARRTAKAVLVGLSLSLVLFLVLDALFTNDTWEIHVLIVFGAASSGILSGLLFYLVHRLQYNMKVLELLKEQASIDKLTELYNRSYLDPFLENQIDTANKSNKPVSMIMVDMDHFKDINDTHGHAIGDHVLTIFAQVVLKCIRKSDIIARYGGDEFIVVLPCTDTETAHLIAERIREEVAVTYIPPVDNVIINAISCSVGVSTYPVLCNSKNTLIKTSDMALYKAKNSGRNCTIVYGKDLALNN